MASLVPVWMNPSSCKGASACKTAFATCLLLKIEVSVSSIRLRDCYQGVPRLAKEDIGLRQSRGGEKMYSGKA